MMMVAIICLGTSCKGKDKGSSGNDDPTPEPTVTYLSEAQFKSSKWKGNQAIGTTALLTVTASDITLNYYVKQDLSKNTDDKFKPVVVKISPYTYDEKAGKFTGTGDDKFNYQGQLSGETQLTITLATSETLKMSKQ